MRGRLRNQIILTDSTNTYLNCQIPDEKFLASKSIARTNLRADSRNSLASQDTNIEDFNSCSSSNSNHNSFISHSQSPDHSATGTELNDDNIALLNSAMQQKKKNMTDETKYKTELCRNFSETGHCPYGKKCKFAHGKHELNEKKVQNMTSYKSKNCNSFHTLMYCPYGRRCMFVHEERNLDELVNINYYEKFINFPELLQNLNTKPTKRLPVFSKMNKNIPDKNIMMFYNSLYEDEFDLKNLDSLLNSSNSFRI